MSYIHPSHVEFVEDKVFADTLISYIKKNASVKTLCFRKGEFKYSDTRVSVSAWVDVITLSGYGSWITDLQTGKVITLSKRESRDLYLTMEVLYNYERDQTSRENKTTLFKSLKDWLL